MRRASFSGSASIVPVLSAIALVLFCLNFLRFVTLHLADDAPPRSDAVAPASLNSLALTRCGYDAARPAHFYNARQALLEARLQLVRLQEQQRHAATVEQELRLRAAQPPEGDEALRHQLGLDEAPVPIMR